jgi:uncharacterized protein (TIGR03083 family)
VTEIDVGRLYRENRERVTDLVRPVPEAQLLQPCPACPGWTVHDVVSHLAGVATDAIAGKLGGIPSDEQTSTQVEERRGRPTTVVLREWERSASQFELVLTKAGPSILPAAIDVAVHEHDIRGALGLTGAHDSETIGVATDRVLSNWSRKLQSLDLAAPALVSPTGDVWRGDPRSPVRWRTTEYEAFRTAFGRRSSAQFARAFDGADPAPYLESLLVFGITDTDLHD